jgi:hypothetical protein
MLRNLLRMQCLSDSSVNFDDPFHRPDKRCSPRKSHGCGLRGSAMLKPVTDAGRSRTNARVRRQKIKLEAGALQTAIFNSANFSSIATDAKGVIQISTSAIWLRSRRWNGLHAVGQ